jgi:hypothetical protein
VWRGKCTREEGQQKQAAREDPGNAPPMRALPLGFVADNADRERLCRANANSTHPHPKAVAASFLIASACRHLVVLRLPYKEVLSAAREALLGSNLNEPKTAAHLAALDELPDYHSYGVRDTSLDLTAPPECTACESEATLRLRVRGRRRVRVHRRASSRCRRGSMSSSAVRSHARTRRIWRVVIRATTPRADACMGCGPTRCVLRPSFSTCSSGSAAL